jgi:2-polyprenyl-3-methyl-5-hydroxy-6-metoxy-1,4-benzoquinol methylase
MNGKPVLKSNFNLVQSTNAASPVNLAVGRLRWGEEADIKKWLNWKSTDESVSGKYDVVMASEVAYQSKSLQILLDTIKQLLDPNGVAIL